ncbi:tRNA (adenosine(37)-N6)-threonylcarbamoyltransferase complex ATPase subunit type 1 TsaE [Listeria costaricensis]|uniref:tRNA (adenosine(37)-N6)-threonylcarbamoyltransferase complex ATPase subunit type 1 TsaE n=1 Tax=Listeria costaricensis TaxID=2026604 RepID=UPI000C06F15A|nr:tRNA (adenosine(37)-N6)-threonylcarbamoyltransferase complex ATPase subunit type 1 TsaE [Listeria costaricensis]
MKWNKATSGEQETTAIAEKIGQHLQAGDIILLEGDLGAGKTTFTKGLAKGLDIEQMVKSPTFTIVREYKRGRLPLYHMDVYRLEELGGDELGFEEYLDGNGVTVIEWAQFIADLLPDEFLKITISRTGDTTRELEFDAHGAHYRQLVTEVLEK